jgi:hypothetical protein
MPGSFLSSLLSAIASPGLAVLLTCIFILSAEGITSSGHKPVAADFISAFVFSSRGSTSPEPPADHFFPWTISI